MKLLLKKLPSTLRGIYGPNKDRLGERQLYAHPDLASAIERLEADKIHLIYSDIFRSPEESLRARRAKPGLVKRPSESPHNVGLAIDIDYAVVMKELGYSKDKKAFDWFLEGYGLYCHNKSHTWGKAEAWHYNALGPSPDQWLAASAARPSTSYAVEAKTVALYGAEWVLKEVDIRALLVKLGHLPIGREYKDGVRDFQKKWDLSVDGVAGVKTQRTLAFVCAEKELV